MKKAVYYILPVIASMTLFSCITSLNPLVTYRNIISQDAAIGKWTGAGQTFILEKALGSEIDKYYGQSADEKKKTPEQRMNQMPAAERKVFQNGYITNFFANGVRYYMVLSFTSINGELYAQLETLESFRMKENESLATPGTSDQSSSAVFGSSKGGYTFAKVVIHKDVMQFSFIDPRFVENQIQSGTAALRNEQDPLFGNMAITASSEELQKFITKYGKDSRLYTKESTLVLTRQH